MAAVYLDHNASSPLRPEARQALLEAYEAGGNASSVHGAGRAARARLEAARETLAALLGAQAAELIFTAGATEANNLALAGLAPEELLVGAGDHPSVLAVVPGARQVGLTPHGSLDLEDLDRALAERPKARVLALMHANNETGVLQPLVEAVARAKAAGLRVHCDAVQAFGRVPLEVEALGVDSLAISAHKLGGPQGVGALIWRDEGAPAALLRGGGQERGRRAGTEAVALAAGFAAAAEAAVGELPGLGRLEALRDGLEARLLGAGLPLRVLGREAPRLANTSCLLLEGVAAEAQVIALDLAGIAVGSGSACSSGKVTPSHVLSAMGCSAAEAKCAIRLSLGWNTRPEDVDTAAAAWLKMADRLSARRVA